MKFKLTLLVLSLSLSNCFILSNNNSTNQWNALKTTWGVNLFNSNNFDSLPRIEFEARNKGWIKEKDCSQSIGNRYTLNGDRSVILIYDISGKIAGIASAIPKNLPFNFPSAKIQRLLNDEGDYFTINAYFKDPALICLSQNILADRLVFKGKELEINVQLNEANISNFGLKENVFIAWVYTIGQV